MLPTILPYLHPSQLPTLFTTLNINYNIKFSYDFYNSPTPASPAQLNILTQTFPFISIIGMHIYSYPSIHSKQINLTKYTNAKRIKLSNPINLNSVTIIHPTLTKLNLSRTIFKNITIQCPTLTIINLSHTLIKNVSILTTCASSLQKINLSHCPNLINLRDLRKCKHLTSLNLSHTPVKDISIIPQLKHITHINLTSCSIDPLILYACPNIKSVKMARKGNKYKDLIRI